MELIKFKGTLYGKLENQLFVWEAAWDSFRPIERIGWTGKEIVAIDKKYKQDIFDPYYGYGSPEMKQLCRRLTDITELDVAESGIELKEEWWRDRFCSFAFECSSRSVQSWKKYIGYMNSRAKTLRKIPGIRITRRKL
jgi:hypothetical protein